MKVFCGISVNTQSRDNFQLIGNPQHYLFLKFSKDSMFMPGLGLESLCTLVLGKNSSITDFLSHFRHALEIIRFECFHDFFSTKLKRLGDTIPTHETSTKQNVNKNGKSTGSKCQQKYS